MVSKQPGSIQRRLATGGVGALWEDGLADSCKYPRSHMLIRVDDPPRSSDSPTFRRVVQVHTEKLVSIAGVGGELVQVRLERRVSQHRATPERAQG